MSQGLSFTDLVKDAKRKSLKDLPPAIPVDKSTVDSIPVKSAPEETIKPKKPIFERYDTYITCPGCGALVRKGTKQCECGYDLSSPISRVGRRLRRAIPVFLCIVLIIASAVAGFFFGQKKMEPQLQKSYDSGYNDGAAVGYSNGYKDGLHDGLTDAAKAQSKTDMPILSDSSIAMPRLYSK